jgi:peptidoglycan/LPS O-acetylase OafA/YrhL
VSSIFTNLFLLQSLDVEDKLTWNGPSWSISTEFYTYMIFALLTLLVAKRTVIPAIGLVVGAGIFFWWAGPNSDPTYQYGLIRCICGFFMGHLVYRLWQHVTLPVGMSTTMGEAVCVICLLVVPTLSLLSTYSILAPALCAPPVLVFALERGAVSRFLKSRPMNFLGIVSYSIYLGHQIIIDLFKRVTIVAEKVFHHQFAFQGVSISDAIDDQYFIVGNVWVGDLITIVFLAAVIALASVTYRYIEMPCRKYFNSVADRLRSTWRRDVRLGRSA